VNIKFLIVSYAFHKANKSDFYSYAPYVREMNLWLKHVDKVRIVAPVLKEAIDPLEQAYIHKHIEFVEVPSINFTTPKKIFLSILSLPLVFFILFREMYWASHIHLRCPGNMGLLGAVAQIFFPGKAKTVKYANNWDWNSYQPVTYRIQQYLLSNTFLTRNTKVLVYGDWKEKSTNIYPFFTASYTNENKIPVELRTIENESQEIRLLFVGTLTANKRPFETIETLESLIAKGVRASLDLIGGGAQQSEIEEYVQSKGLQNIVRIHGKLSPDDVIDFFKSSHFLIFLSYSEGWPKVVAESMWWGCLPITTNVSCVSQMVGNMERGILIEPDPELVADKILVIIDNPVLYKNMCQAAMNWSREYTLERFEEEIVKLLKGEI
jgi:glycosyltransferase involved in cell wall biosynthesis